MGRRDNGMGLDFPHNSGWEVRGSLNSGHSFGGLLIDLIEIFSEQSQSCGFCLNLPVFCCVQDGKRIEVKRAKTSGALRSNAPST